MSGADSGPVVQALPLLRRKVPAAPGELKPVPPFESGTMPSETFGVVNLGLVHRSPVEFLPLPVSRAVQDLLYPLVGHAALVDLRHSSSAHSTAARDSSPCSPYYRTWPLPHFWQRAPRRYSEFH